MKHRLGLTAILLSVSSCIAPLDPAEVQRAEVFFPPRFRYVPDPQYCFTPAERERAIQEYKKVGADTLFEVVVDGEGAVKKARLIKTRQPSDRYEDLVLHMRTMTFSPDAKRAAYRGFYFPVKYTYNSDFEWIDQ